MAIQKTDKVWYNGKLINWDDANIHVMSHVVHYGSSVFEGIRCYELPTGPAIFRAQDHMQRLLDSAKVYRMDVPFTHEEIVRGMVETISVQRPVALLHPPCSFPRIRRCRRKPAELPGRDVHLQLSVGKISRRSRRCRRRLRFLLDASCPEHASRYGQGRRELHEFAAHQNGSDRQWIRRGYRARQERIRQRRIRREHFPRASRQADHGPARQFRSARHHARFNHPGSPMT